MRTLINIVDRAARAQNLTALRRVCEHLNNTLRKLSQSGIILASRHFILSGSAFGSSQAF